MLKVGLTGNIGSGKSVVAGIFSVLGVPVYHADDESKKFLADPLAKAEITARFGSSVEAGDGSIDRRALAGIVFHDPEALKALNAILHPRVRNDFRDWALRHAGHPYLLQEAAIIFESGIRAEYDLIIHVSCPKETAIDRVVKRDRTDGRSVLLRMQFQMEDSAKAKLADFVIRNDGTQPVIPQVLAIHQKLLEIGTQRNDQVAPGAADA